MSTGGGEFLDVGGGVDAAFGDEDFGGAVRMFLGAGDEAHARVEGDFERAQIAVVDADDGGTGVERAVEFGFVVNFDKGVQAGFAGHGKEEFQFLIAEDRDDEEDGIGAVFDRFENLERIDNEILAQNGEMNGVADGAHVIPGTLEKFFVGEDRDAARAGLFVGASDGDRIEIGADHAGGRRGFFDFGDEGGLAVARETELGGEIAALAMRFDGPAEMLGERRALRERGYFEFFLLNNFFENVQKVILPLRRELRPCV